MKKLCYIVHFNQLLKVRIICNLDDSYNMDKKNLQV